MRITTTARFTPEELKYLMHDLRPKNDADRATKEIVRNINNAASMALTKMEGSIPWITRDPSGEPIHDILSDTWIRCSETGEFRMAQLHGKRKGFLVHVIHNATLQAYLKTGDFVCLPSVSLMVTALEQFLETGRFDAEVIRC